MRINLTCSFIFLKQKWYHFLYLYPFCMKKICYILPVYNEESNLQALYQDILKSIDNFTTKYAFEFLFIDDGSFDKSLTVLTTLAKKDDRVKIISFSRNFGHQAAITAGLKNTNADCAIIMDCDLQDPAYVATQMIQKWEEGFDIVYGRRKSRKDSFFKKFSSSVFYRFLNSLSQTKIPNDTGDFRLIDRKVIDSFNQINEKNRYIRGIFSYIGFTQTEVLYDRNKRLSGKTKYPLSKMLKLSIDGITSFSTVPLKLITQMGLLVSFASFAGITYVLIMKLLNPEQLVSGWTTLILAILFMGGIQLVMLGILGSYIGRIYIEVQNRPLYIISSIIEGTPNKASSKRL
jgi:polyisoprenyl-phosphate glycosyltransferase